MDIQNKIDFWDINEWVNSIFFWIAYTQMRSYMRLNHVLITIFIHSEFCIYIGSV